MIIVTKMTIMMQVAWVYWYYKANTNFIDCYSTEAFTASLQTYGIWSYSTIYTWNMAAGNGYRSSGELFSPTCLLLTWIPTGMMNLLSST